MSSDKWRWLIQIHAGNVLEYFAGVVVEIGMVEYVIRADSIMTSDSIEFLPLKGKHKARYLD